jgi:flagellar M-ring protein FliF
VRSAVGIDDKRGDSLQVVNMQFAQEEAQTLTPEEQPFLGLTKADIMKLVELGVMALIALLAILLVFRPMIKRLLAPIAIAGAAVTPAGALPGSAPPVMVAGPDGVLVPAALPAPGMSSVSQAEVSARIGSAERMIDIAQVDGQVSASSVKKVGEIVSKHPEEAVAIMRQWMHDPG